MLKFGRERDHKMKLNRVQITKRDASLQAGSIKELSEEENESL